MVHANSKTNAILVLSYWICNCILLVHGNTLFDELAKQVADIYSQPLDKLRSEHHETPILDTGDRIFRLVTTSSPVKKSVISIQVLDKTEKGATITPEQLPKQIQLNPQLNRVTEEQITSVVKPRPKSLGGLFYSLLQFIFGKIFKTKKPLRYEEINSDAVYLFEALKRTSYVEDKTEKIKRVTHYIRQSDLYTGRFERKSKFGEQFDEIETTRNGDCFYSAVSLLFFGHENFARGLRAITAAHIAINQQFFMALNVIIHEEYFTWTSVLNDKRFAESIEVIFLSNILCRHIKIYESGGRNWYQHALIGCKSPKEPLHLHLHRQHYSALARKYTFPPVNADTFQLPDLPPLRIF